MGSFFSFISFDFLVGSFGLFPSSHAISTKNRLIIKNKNSPTNKKPKLKFIFDDEFNNFIGKQEPLMV